MDQDKSQELTPTQENEALPSTTPVPEDLVITNVQAALPFAVQQRLEVVQQLQQLRGSDRDRPNSVVSNVSESRARYS